MLYVNVDEQKYGDLKILENVDIKFYKSSKLNIISGPSGCGKTTLAKIIKNNKFNDKAHITFNGKENFKCSLIDQETIVFENLSLYENLIIFSDNIQHIKQLIDLFGLTNQIDTKGYELSGGQQQRLAIIRALIQDTDVLILDEPTSGLDKRNFKNLVKYLSSVSSDVLTIIITHDKRFEEIDSNKYIYENKTFRNYNASEVASNNDNTVFDNTKDLTYASKLFFKNFAFYNIIKSIFIFAVSICLIFLATFFISIVNSERQIDNFVLGDEYLVLSFNDLATDYVSNINGDVVGYNEESINFTTKQIEDISNIDNVSNIYPLRLKDDYKKDMYGNKLYLQINRSKIESIVSADSFNSFDEYLNFEFTMLDLPYTTYKDNRFGNVTELNIIEGDYPKDNSNEILLPDFLLYNVDDASIDLDVLDENNMQISKTYTISGYYNTDFEVTSKQLYPIYISYNTLQPNIDDDFSYQFNNYYLFDKDIDNVFDFFATGYDTLLIKASDNNVIDVYESIRMLDDNYLPISNQTIRRDYKDYFRKLWLNNMIIYSITLICSLILVNSILSLFLNKLEYGYLLLVSNNYTKKELLKIIFPQLVIEFLVLLIISICIINYSFFLLVLYYLLVLLIQIVKIFNYSQKAS